MNYFTIKPSFFLVSSIQCDEEFKKIDKFMELLENSGVAKYIEYVNKKSQYCKGRTGYNPYNLFAAIIYCFSKFKASLRDIEDKCIFDVRVCYIMEGYIPDHSTIGNFINKYIVPFQREIFTTINKQIIKELHLKINDIYNDGTKFEANANKYKFVWKPTKFHKRLNEKIKSLLKEMKMDYTNDVIQASELYSLINDYVRRENIDIHQIPTGKGKRKTKEQKYYKEIYEKLIKLLEYEEKERICGENRNSYYKTDKDATAMVLKEDYYSKSGHDFHAGYNVQVMVSNLLILMYGVFQDRSDYYTFITMNDLYYQYYQEYPKNECADAGYGIYKKYKYMNEHHINNYVKFQQWEGEVSGKRPQLFYTFEDGVMCLNTDIGEKILFSNRIHQRKKDGVLYRFKGCNQCGYSYICKKHLKDKSKDYRYIELNPEYELYKEQSRNNLLSPKGIEIRINRSIQVEGTFGQIKNNMNYERIRRRGFEKVSSEIMLMSLGVNIRRYFSALKNKKIKENCWDAPATLQPEKMPIVKQKEKKPSRN